MTPRKKTETVHVACALIEKKGKFLIAQRKPEDHMGGYWEFPGGKCEAGETVEEALVREVSEELGVTVRPERLISETSLCRPPRRFILYFFLCRWVCGEPARLDCHDFCWVEPEGLTGFMFPPSDAEVIKDLIDHKHDYLDRS